LAKAQAAAKQENHEETADSPLLDTMGASVKKMVAKGKERGYVTYEELNAALPPEDASSEQIEDTMAMLSEMGINVVENEEHVFSVELPDRCRVQINPSEHLESRWVKIELAAQSIWSWTNRLALKQLAEEMA